MLSDIKFFMRGPFSREPQIPENPPADNLRCVRRKEQILRRYLATATKTELHPSILSHPDDFVNWSPQPLCQDESKGETPLTGYTITLSSSGVNYGVLLRKSVTASAITGPSGGTSVTIPWVMNTNTGSGDLVSPRPAEAVQAALRALLDDRAANGDPQ